MEVSERKITELEEECESRYGREEVELEGLNEIGLE